MDDRPRCKVLLGADGSEVDGRLPPLVIKPSLFVLLIPVTTSTLSLPHGDQGDHDAS